MIPSFEISTAGGLGDSGSASVHSKDNAEYVIIQGYSDALLLDIHRVTGYRVTATLSS